MKLDILRHESRQIAIKCAGSLERRDKRLINQGSDVPRIIFFLLFLIDLGHSKLVTFIIKKNEKCVETIFEKDFARDCKKGNAWNIRCLVDESFVLWPSASSKPAYYIED